MSCRRPWRGSAGFHPFAGLSPASRACRPTLRCSLSLFQLSCCCLSSSRHSGSSRRGKACSARPCSSLPRSSAQHCWRAFLNLPSQHCSASAGFAAPTTRSSHGKRRFTNTSNHCRYTCAFRHSRRRCARRCSGLRTGGTSAQRRSDVAADRRSGGSTLGQLLVSQASNERRRAKRNALLRKLLEQSFLNRRNWYKEIALTGATGEDARHRARKAAGEGIPAMPFTSSPSEAQMLTEGSRTHHASHTAAGAAMTVAFRPLGTCERVCVNRRKVYVHQRTQIVESRTGLIGNQPDARLTRSLSALNPARLIGYGSGSAIIGRNLEMQRRAPTSMHRITCSALRGIYSH